MNSNYLSEKKIKFIILFLITSSLITSLFAITRNTDLQKKQLSYTDSLLDAAIIEQNLRLQKTLELVSMSVKRKMNNSKFIQAKNYIEIQQYNIENRSLKKDNITQIKDRSIRLYYSKDHLTKIETRLINQNLKNSEASVSFIIDPSPLTKDNEDIIIKQVLLKGITKPIGAKGISFKNLKIFKTNKIYTKLLGKLPNTTFKPFRIDFKKGFYIPLLREFEYQLRALVGLQLPTKINKQVEIIERLKDSHSY